MTEVLDCSPVSTRVWRTVVRAVHDACAAVLQPATFRVELRPVRDLSRQPIFQISFVVQNLPERELRLPGITLREVPDDSGAAQLDLSLDAVPDAFAGDHRAPEYVKGVVTLTSRID